MSLVRPDGEDFQKYTPWDGVRPSDEEYAKHACRCDDQAMACGYCMFVQSGARVKIKPEPMPPFQAHSETSRAAARQVLAKPMRQIVLEELQKRRARGATDDELQDLLGMDPSTERPRRVELERAGLIIDSGERRKTKSGRAAVVWVVV